jgi:4-hydroxy-3-polyprenylbenzoate decarboxylase
VSNSSLPIAVGISGASGMVYAVRLLKFLLAQDFSVDLVVSKSAMMVWQSEEQGVIPVNLTKQTAFWRQYVQETGGKLICHHWADVSASLASGSYRTQGMIVMPCSMATVAKIAHGFSSDLLERTADVQIKEGRRLVLVPRETPFSLIHLRNLTLLAEAGVRIVPAIPAWYHQPQSILDLVDFVVARALDQLDIDSNLMERWQGRK